MIKFMFEKDLSGKIAGKGWECRQWWDGSYSSSEEMDLTITQKQSWQSIMSQSGPRRAQLV